MNYIKLLEYSHKTVHFKYQRCRVRNSTEIFLCEMILMLPRNASCNICVLGVFFCSDHMTSKFGCVYKRSEWICNATVPVCNSPCQLTSVQPLICPIITKSQFVLSNELSSNQVLLSSQFYH